MRVLVTGGTGYVGCHTVRALLDADHDVRLLVRDRARVATSLEPVGLPADAVEAVEGDLLDRPSLEAALEGMDALIHAASMYTLDLAAAEQMQRVNVEGARTILGLAHERRLDPIVHVSSIAALLSDSPGAEVPVHPDAPIGTITTPYCGSKAAQERIARELQAAGAPVVTTYPGMVAGPHDPYDGETVRAARTAVRGGLRLCPKGGYGISDVRDVAAIHAALVEPGRGPRRYIAAGTQMRLAEIVHEVTTAAGRPQGTVAVPDGLALAAGRMMDAVSRLTGKRMPAGYEGSLTATQWPIVDPSATVSDLGVTFRPPQETFTDHVEWQQAAGRL